MTYSPDFRKQALALINNQGRIEQILPPELPAHSMIVMDNTTFHKRQDIQDLITEQGYNILWLPPNSPT